jgi:subtilisin family serine protease
MDDTFAIVHISVSQFTNQSITRYGYYAIPNLYGLTSEASLDASGVFELRRIPNFNLRGQGVLVGIIDTGIDYDNPVFLNADGTTKILSIWDQNIQSEEGAPFNTNFGTEYLKEQINQALLSDNPLNIVPSTDENGHGTMMAAIAAGTEVDEENFYGVAPDSELVIVKLRPAKEYLKKFFFIPQEALCYQENSIMWGLLYCVSRARQENRPIVICLGMGSSQTSHNGGTPLGSLMSTLGDFPRVVMVTSVGNEGNLGRHYYGLIDPVIGYNTVELNVSENDKGLSMFFWGDAPGIYTLDILSPSGEYIPRIASGLRVFREISFIFEQTVIYIDILTVETETGDQFILLRFNNVSPGIWRFNVYGQGDLLSGFHIWLPMGDMITRGTYFVQPDIYTTVLSPSTAVVPISVTAYNPVNGTLYINASRGYTRSNSIKPDFGAPGVNYVAPALNGQFIPYNGTGVAASHTAGISALILEWGVVRGNQPTLDTIEIKKYLIRGAERSNILTYPNRDWGYGMLDVFNVFDILRG